MNDCNRHSGRPSKLTDDTALGIALLVEQGNYLDTAARAWGVHPKTVRKWLQLGRKFPDGQYAAFRSLVIGASSASEINAVARLNALARDDGRLLLDMLARRFPERWSKHTHQITQIRQELRALVKEIAQLEAVRDRPNG